MLKNGKVIISEFSKTRKFIDRQNEFQQEIAGNSLTPNKTGYQCVFSPSHRKLILKTPELSQSRKHAQPVMHKRLLQTARETPVSKFNKSVYFLFN